MKDAKWIKLDELRGQAASRRVNEALKLVSEEMTDFDDDDLPEMPAGVVMKNRPDGGGRAPL